MSTATPQQRGQRLFMIGMGLVMGALILGGGLAMVFYFMGMREIAMVAAGLAAFAIAVGVVLQVQGARRLKAPPAGSEKP